MLLSLAMLLGCPTPANEKEEDIVFSISSDLLEFGEVEIGDTESLDVLFRCCAAEQSVDVTAVVMVDGDPNVWMAEITDEDQTITRSHDVPVTITFEPRDEEEYSGVVEVDTTFRAEPIVIEFTGTGTAPPVDPFEDNDGDGVTVGQGDCDDNDPDLFPGNTEKCNGIDDDCDLSVPADETDGDLDGYRLCEDDCDDTDFEINPGATEFCDGKDSDCNGINEDIADLDADGSALCDAIPDCDDNDNQAFPGNNEICDGKDNDCNNTVDDLDFDNDGHSPCLGGGDCDDNNSSAFPVVMSTTGTSTGAGTDADPVDSLFAAAGKLDSVCRTIAILPGTYSNVSFTWAQSQVLTIEGRGSTQADVVLSNAAGRMIDLSGAADLTVQDLTLADGVSLGAGGAVRLNGGQLTLRNVTLEDNYAPLNGGAVDIATGTLVLQSGVVFDGNFTDGDGGAIANNLGTLTDTQGGTVYVDNRAGDDGAGIFTNDGTVTVQNARFEGNDATDSGGALYATGSNSLLTFENNEIWVNEAAVGGGITLHDFSDTLGVIRNNWIQDNDAADKGGGMAVTGGLVNANIYNNTFAGNGSANDGAGVHLEAAAGGGIRFWSNLVTWSQGWGGVYIVQGSPDLQYNSSWRTSSGFNNDFAGQTSGLDLSNTYDDDPLFAVPFSNDGDPSNDDLTPSGSGIIDNGVPAVEFNDPDSSRNDRGATGGPAAQ